MTWLSALSLRGARRPLKGSYTITDDFFADIIIPRIKSKHAVNSLIDDVDTLRDVRKKAEHEDAQKRIDMWVSRLVSET